MITAIPEIPEDKCWKPEWKDKCCCNCVESIPLHSHPWVDGKPLSHKIGYVCLLFYHMEGGSQAVISDGHGLCECHTLRKATP
jgi:hypothetical protein